jgi:L-ascorbate metabolism protein UlaG (beta-lactamase superfamily)
MQSRRALMLGAAAAVVSPFLGGCAARRFDRFCGNAAPPTDDAIAARFLGATTILFQDRETAILSDGFISRPSFGEVVTGRPIGSDRKAIADTLQCLDVPSIAAVFAGHSHYDHALDTAMVADLTGAVVLGSDSTRKALGPDFPPHRIRVVRDGDTARFGRFELTFIESRHSPIDLAPGSIEAPIRQPAPASAWKTGPVWSVFVRHGSRTLLVHGSANWVDGALDGRHADVVYLGVGGIGFESRAFVSTYWDEVVARTGARRVYVVHWDNFFRGLDRPIQRSRSPIDAYRRTMRRFRRLAERDGVQLLVPEAWRSIDPFAGLA